MDSQCCARHPEDAADGDNWTRFPALVSLTSALPNGSVALFMIGRRMQQNAYLSTVIQNETLRTRRSHASTRRSQIIRFSTKAIWPISPIRLSSCSNTSVGTRHAACFPTLIHELCTGQRHEEDLMWKQPHDLVAISAKTLSLIEAEPLSSRPLPMKAIVEGILADDPDIVADTLVKAFRSGMYVAEIALAIATAAAIRLARFRTRNELQTGTGHTTE